MSVSVLTLEPDVLAATGQPSPWEDALIAFVREAAQSGQTVVVSTETKFFTPEEAARRLMVSRSTISRRIADGEIQAVRVGNRHRIPYAEVERVWRDSMHAMAAVVAPDIEAALIAHDVAPHPETAAQAAPRSLLESLTMATTLDEAVIGEPPRLSHCLRSDMSDDDG